MPKAKLTSIADVKHEVVKMEQQEAIVDGDWYVWGDPVEPVLENVSYETMKNKIDTDTTNTLYGENTKNGDLYEGGE